MNQILILNIKTALNKAKKRGLSFKELMSASKVGVKGQREFRECLRFLEKNGEIIDRKTKIYATKFLDIKPATVTRLNKTFGFVKLNEDESEMFIPGKYFMGALPGDTVLVSPIPSRGTSPEGEIVKILTTGQSEFTGTLYQSEFGAYISPDNMIKFDLPIRLRDIGGAKIGDKVLCAITERGERHSDHKVKVIASYGDSQTAANCAQALLDLNGIKLAFPEKAQAEAIFLNQKGISQKEMVNRLDLRDEKIFTIDGADTKDIDDAISIKKLGNYYELSVHIADVSHYVKPGSPIEDEAFNRGTSIYFADRVVPMLPRELSNGICSLNPNEDRLAFSCIMTVDKDGKLIDFDFKKSIINSKVKGVYSEINQILDSSENDEIKAKYRLLYDSIFLMKELANILTRNKKARGAPDIETSESWIVLDKNSVAVDIIPRTRGESEVIIEEFMLIANEAAASAARLKDIPFVYRVHEPPSEQKIDNLHGVLSLLGMDCKDVRLNMPASVLAKLITKSRGLPIYPIVNNMVLRSMSKAKYFEVPIGHFGLVLENYAQFTSPIRRYPDLTIHRILSEVVKGTPLPKVRKMYEKEVVKASRRSTETELNAMKLERECDDRYKAEYMKAHIGEEYDGIISSLAPHGLYVELANTVEGLLKVENLPAGEYSFDEMIQYKNTLDGKTYRIGDAIKIKCIGVDVSAGNIDFSAV